MNKSPHLVADGQVANRLTDGRNVHRLPPLAGEVVEARSVAVVDTPASVGAVHSALRPDLRTIR